MGPEARQDLLASYGMLLQYWFMPRLDSAGSVPPEQLAEAHGFLDAELATWQEQDTCAPIIRDFWLKVLHLM
jgi:hypothetical protein